MQEKLQQQLEWWGVCVDKQSWGHSYQPDYNISTSTQYAPIENIQGRLFHPPLPPFPKAFQSFSGGRRPSMEMFLRRPVCGILKPFWSTNQLSAVHSKPRAVLQDSVPALFPELDQVRFDCLCVYKWDCSFFGLQCTTNKSSTIIRQ